MDIKFNADSPATAPANKVLPDPGAPYNNTPDCIFNGHCLNTLGYYEKYEKTMKYIELKYNLENTRKMLTLDGHIKISVRSCFAASNPPTFFHVMDEFLWKSTPFKERGVISETAMSISCSLIET